MVRVTSVHVDATGELPLGEFSGAAAANVITLLEAGPSELNGGQPASFGHKIVDVRFQRTVTHGSNSISPKLEIRRPEKIEIVRDEALEILEMPPASKRSG
jgi:hypothetical protein